jgi:predicted acylesterase/phospholipase RssA
VTDEIKNNTTGIFSRVLVLAGGGAKGAYAFGALKAFRDRGVQFDAVAGTSVGALNALLWATQSLDRYQQLWAQLSFENTYPPALLAWFPNWARKVIGTTYCLFRVLWSSARRIPTPDYKWLDLLVAFAVSLIVTAPLSIAGVLSIYGISKVTISYHSISIPLDLGNRFSGLVMIVFAVGGIISFCSRRKKGTWILFLSGGAMWGLALVGGCVLLLNHIAERSLRLIAYGVSVAAIPLLIWLIAKGRKWFRRNACLAQEPLRQTIENILSHEKLTIPTFVTCAYQQEVFDPKDGSFSRATSGAEVMFGEVEPNTHYNWVPNYIRINELSIKDACNVCLASAALPYGVVPAITLTNELRSLLHLPDTVSNFVDGGVADNVPYFPFVEDFPANELFIVLLKPCTDERCTLVSDVNRETWIEREYALRIAKLGVPRLKRLNPPQLPDYVPWPEPLEAREPVHWPKRITFFFP